MMEADIKSRYIVENGKLYCFGDQGDDAKQDERYDSALQHGIEGEDRVAIQGDIGVLVDWLIGCLDVSLRYSIVSEDRDLEMYGSSDFERAREPEYDDEADL